MVKALATVKADTLHELDGGNAGGIINACIRDAVNDIHDRGDDNKARKVAITLEFIALDGGAVGVRLEASAKLPMRRSNRTVGDISQNGNNFDMSFRVSNPEDPQQTTIMDYADVEGTDSGDSGLSS